ncbi:hypothetical protein [Marinobacter sp. GH_1]
MVVIGMRYGSQTMGIGKFSNEAINEALKKSSGSQIVRPKGGVINRVGPGMSGNYAVIRNGNGKLLANATSVAGLQGKTPTVSTQVEMLLAHENSVAARMSRGLTSQSKGVLLRWAPPGMLAVFGWNTIASIEGISRTVRDLDFGKLPKDIATLAYGATNLLYWLGHIVEAENSVQQNRLSWLTKTRLDVDKISNVVGKSIARRLFADRLMSIAKFAGAFGAGLEVILSLWEGVQRLRANDTDAAAGYFIAAAGFGVFMFSHLAGAGVIPIIGVSFAAALAAVALLVALSALVWAIFKTDDALEVWLKHGPFGKENPGRKYTHLHDEPEDSFQFMVNGLFPLKGTSGSLAEFNDRRLLSKTEKDWLEDHERTEGQIIAVSSAAFALVDEPDEQFNAKFWISTRQGHKAKSIEPEFVFYDAERQMLRFHLPKPRWRWAGRSRSLERLTAKVRITLGNGGLLPVSDMEKPLVSGVDVPTLNDDSPRWLTITS